MKVPPPPVNKGLIELGLKFKYKPQFNGYPLVRPDKHFSLNTVNIAGYDLKIILHISTLTLKIPHIQPLGIFGIFRLKLTTSI